MCLAVLLYEQFCRFENGGVACVAADSFPFSGGAEIEQANEKRASEGARLRLEWTKNLGRSREGVSKKGEGRGENEPSPHPLPLLLILPLFRTRAFVKGKETAATQANGGAKISIKSYFVRSFFFFSIFSSSEEL